MSDAHTGFGVGIVHRSVVAAPLRRGRRLLGADDAGSAWWAPPQRGGLKMLAGQSLAEIFVPGLARSARSELTSSTRALTSEESML